MKPYYKNPRKITTKQMTELKFWLTQLGDLSGIVHDLNSDEIIGGNQRFKIFDLGEYQIDLQETMDPPDDQGTVGRGFIIWNGKKYNYRQVRWSEATCEQANIIANKAGGTFDFNILGKQFDSLLLLNVGFQPYEFQLPTTEIKVTEPEDPDPIEIIKIKLAPPILARYNALISSMPGKSEAERFINLLNQVAG